MNQVIRNNEISTKLDDSYGRFARPSRRHRFAVVQAPFGQRPSIQGWYCAESAAEKALRAPSRSGTGNLSIVEVQD